MLCSSEPIDAFLPHPDKKKGLDLREPPDSSRTKSPDDFVLVATVVELHAHVPPGLAALFVEVRAENLRARTAAENFLTDVRRDRLGGDVALRLQDLPVGRELELGFKTAFAKLRLVAAVVEIPFRHLRVGERLGDGRADGFGDVRFAEVFGLDGEGGQRRERRDGGDGEGLEVEHMRLLVSRTG